MRIILIFLYHSRHESATLCTVMTGMLLFLASILGAEENLLYILHAKKAYVEFGEGAVVSGTLHLVQVDHSVAFFSQRPDRHAGKITLSNFLKRWSLGEESFADEPPNAGFVFYIPSMSPKAQTAQYFEANFMLENPRYDPSDNALYFDIDVIDSHGFIPDGELLEPTLFIGP